MVIPPLTPQDVEHLKQFYRATTLEEIISMQVLHIRGLQEALNQRKTYWRGPETPPRKG